MILLEATTGVWNVYESPGSHSDAYLTFQRWDTGILFRKSAGLAEIRDKLINERGSDMRHDENMRVFALLAFDIEILTGQGVLEDDVVIGLFKANSDRKRCTIDPQIL